MNWGVRDIPTPKEMVGKLDDWVIGQAPAKKVSPAGYVWSCRLSLGQPAVVILSQPADDVSCRRRALKQHGCMGCVSTQLVVAA